MARPRPVQPATDTLAPAVATARATSSPSTPAEAAPVPPAASSPPAESSTSAAAVPPGPTEPVRSSSGQLEEGPEPAATAAGTAAVQQSALGTVSAVPVPAGVAAPESGRTVRYSVEVEDGIAADVTDFARTVSSVLGDSRGWRTAAGASFQPVAPEQVRAGEPVDVRVTLATPQLTARLCAPLDTSVSQVSCWNRGRAVVNLQRWSGGAATYGDDLERYRTYLVNHEVGHGLGFFHQRCPAPAQPAPIMVQQTKSLEGCTPGPWPTRP